MSKKIDLMHELFGEDYRMDKCEICDHLKKVKIGTRTVYKCECYGITSSEATDWRLRYLACGLIFKEYKGTSVMKLVGRIPKEDMQIEGQLSLDEFIGFDIPDDKWVKSKESISTKFDVRQVNTFDSRNRTRNLP